MSGTTNWETLAIQAAEDPARPAPGAEIPHLNAWRLAKRFRMEDTARHVLNVGLSNYDREYRHRGWEVPHFASSLVEWMDRNRLIHPQVDRSLLQSAIRDFLEDLAAKR